eukprot:4448403-Amphidinium_carterae.5
MPQAQRHASTSGKLEAIAGLDKELDDLIRTGGQDEPNEKKAVAEAARRLGALKERVSKTHRVLEHRC